MVLVTRKYKNMVPVSGEALCAVSSQGNKEGNTQPDKGNQNSHPSNEGVIRSLPLAQ